MRHIEDVLEGLWTDYVTLNPHALAVHDLLQKREGGPLTNDHIAFRTFNCGPITMASLAERFKGYGYKHGGDYDIKERRVTALYLKPPSIRHPRVFISELRVNEFSPDFQNIIFEMTRRVGRKFLERKDFLWSGAPWGAIPYLRYQRLAMESEYASWLAAFGIRANHFTVSVNQLGWTQDLKEVNALVKSAGHRLNVSGGEIKGSPEQLLEQSSTMAGRVKVDFIDGAREVPGCYYEFAKRHRDQRGKLFDGFIESSATRIFDSTNASTTRTEPATPPAPPPKNGESRDARLLDGIPAVAVLGNHRVRTATDRGWD